MKPRDVSGASRLCPADWEISADFTDYAEFVSDSLRSSWDRIKRLCSKLFAPLIDRFEKIATEFFVNLESRPGDLIGLIVHCRKS
jgi:hypothetical protein